MASNKNNTLFSSLKTYNNDLVLKEIEKYLCECKSKKNCLKEISKQIFKKFINNDDKHLLKLMKKMLIIYKRCHTKILQSHFYKWQIIAIKYNNGLNNYKYNTLNNNEFNKPQFINTTNSFVQKIKDIYKNNTNNRKNKAYFKNSNKSFNNKNKYNCFGYGHFTPFIKKTFLNSSDRKNQSKNSPLKIKREIINRNIHDIYGKKKNNTFQKKNYLKLNKNMEKCRVYNNIGNNNIDNNYEERNSDDDNNNINFVNFQNNTKKPKSIDRRNNNLSFRIANKKPWAYSYFNRDNNSKEDNISSIMKKKRPKMNSKEKQELFDNLYNDSKKENEKYKIINKEKEEKFNNIYTFTPKILNNKLNRKYFKNMTDSKFNKSSNNLMNKSNGFNNTQMITNMNYNDYLLYKGDNNNTYTNNKNRLEALGEMNNKVNYSLDFISRLEEYEKIKKNNLQKIINEIETSKQNNENSDLNNNKNKYYNKIPDNHLLNDCECYFANKQNMIKNIEENMNKEQGITFHPQTNKSFNDKIKDDLLKRSGEFIKDKQEKVEKYKKLKEKEFTFKPKVNSLTNIQILNKKNEDNKYNQNNSDVSQRLYDYLNKYRENKENIRKKYLINYTFKPEISRNTDLILNNRKKMFEKMKENENTLINDIRNDSNKKNNIINYYYINNELLKKQKKLDELKEISKKINKMSDENNVYTDKKFSSKKKRKNKNSNSRKKIPDNYNQKKPYMINNNINQENIYDKKSDKNKELAQNLMGEDYPKVQNFVSSQNHNMNYDNNNCEDLIIDNNNNNRSNEYNTNDLIQNLKMSNNNYNCNNKYNFDNNNNKRIMDLNYYDILLK